VLVRKYHYLEPEEKEKELSKNERNYLKKSRRIESVKPDVHYFSSARHLEKKRKNIYAK